jgi:UDP-N-acetylglucosamine 3-dehydrogenase
VRFGLFSFAHMHAWGYANAIVNKLPEHDLVGIADDDSERGEEMAATFETEFFDSYEKLADAGIDSGCVCTENARHIDLVRLLAPKKKHILCEKPLATTLQDGREMIELCGENGVQLATSFSCRFSPAYTQLRDAVHSGRLGEILAVKATNHGMCPGDWFVQEELSGGGAVMDHTVHVADLLRDLLKSEAATVYAEITNTIRRSDTDDIGLLTIEFENGVFATLDASWSRPPKSYPTWGDVTMEVIGTLGTATMDMFAQSFALHSEKTQKSHWESWGSDLDTPLVADFASAAAHGRRPATSGEDGLRALEMALAAYESARRCAPVDVGRFSGRS